MQESADGGNDGGDFGIIPGAGKKKNLLKSGADKLCDVYGLADRYIITSRTEDFVNGLFDYTIQCELYRKTDEMFVGSGLGSCNSFEAKYRWRQAQRACPTCGQETIIKGKAEYGGGWVCWKNKGGCGAKFSAEDPEIVGQKVGRVENPDIADSKNTVIKMAKKRAKIDAVISVTRSSGIFTQDLDEEPHDGEPRPQHTESQHADQKADQNGAKDTPAGETHAEKIARIKAEAQAASKSSASAPVNGAGAKKAAATAPASPGPVAATPSPSTATTSVPPQAAPTPESTPAVGASTSKSDLPAPPEGHVYITSINAKSGPLVLKDGKQQPAWGPLFIIAFSHKVRASDKVMVADANTFDAELAALAEAAREPDMKPVKVTVEPGKKKGSYVVTKIEA